MNKSQFCIHIAIQGVSHKEAKNSSVKKVLLLAIVPDISECHFNVKSILDQVDFGDLKYIYAVDVKMGNINDRSFKIYSK